MSSLIRITEIDKEIATLKAEKEQLIKTKKKETAVDRYGHTYNGKRLLEEYPLNTEGTWEVRGEDPNCDMGGHHSQPLLGHFKGTLEAVIKEAVSLPNFWTWGGGGSIKKVSDNYVTDLSK